jgi:1-aminocyclopropane-1-carboxylate deaminase/D-cysteine desulfhydrase-like pyridoxal-dependent ACC family enzyme
MLKRYDLQSSSAWTVLEKFHGGGYARAGTDLLAFMTSLTATTGLPLEPVYSGKLFWALGRMISEGYFQDGSKILAIHGGGLQGNRGFINKFK